jgi:hypothetical protein
MKKFHIFQFFNNVYLVKFFIYVSNNHSITNKQLISNDIYKLSKSIFHLKQLIFFKAYKSFINPLLIYILKFICILIRRLMKSSTY